VLLHAPLFTHGSEKHGGGISQVFPVYIPRPKSKHSQENVVRSSESVHTPVFKHGLELHGGGISQVCPEKLLVHSQEDVEKSSEFVQTPLFRQGSPVHHRIL